MKETIVGITIGLLAFYVLIYFPVSWGVKTDCLKKGYPNYAVDFKFTGYCRNAFESFRVK